MTARILLVIAGAVGLTPIIGGFLTGLDRKMTALMQGRYGPPVWQSFYDIVKLFYKQPLLVNDFQVMAALVYLFSAVLSTVFFALKSDLLMIIFIMSVGSIFYVVGALTTTSPYSQVGAHRELIQMLVYEPLLILCLVGIYFETGSFNIGFLLYQRPLLLKLPLIFAALSLVLDIKLKKSPFDFSASEHAHQELVRGIQTDYSGPYLAVIEIAHWYELVLILGIMALFWSSNLLIGCLFSLFVLFLEILIDNITARMTLKWMVGFSWVTGFLLIFSNMAYLYIRR